MSSRLERLNEMQNRYDGALPPDALAYIESGSLDLAAISDNEATARAYRQMLIDAVKAGKAAFRRGDLRYSRACIAEAKAFLRCWRICRRNIAKLRGPVQQRRAA